MVLRGLTMADLELWIDGFFNFFTAELFTVAGVQFSFWDVFSGGVVLSIFGYACGKLFFKAFDNRYR